MWCLSKPIEHTPPGGNPNVSHGRRVATVCHWRVIGMLPSGKAVCWGGGGPWEFSLLSTQFCYELKTPLKSKVFFLMA